MTKGLVFLSACLGLSLSACSSSSSTLPTGPAPPLDGGNGVIDAAPPVCPPTSAAGFSPTWSPIAAMPGACTDTQLNDLIAACFDSQQASTAACGAWEHAAANQACAACWLGPVTATKSWTPFLYADNPGETDYINIGGCVALADPSNATCGKAVQAELQCELKACLQQCTVPAFSPDAGNATEVQDASNALYACYAAADQGGCQSFASAASACAAGLEDGGTSAFCFAANKDTGSLLQLFQLACGTVQVGDGGPPADSGPADAGVADGAPDDGG